MSETFRLVVNEQDTRKFVDAIMAVQRITKDRIAMEINTERMRILTTDPANIAMVNMQIGAGFFEEVDVQGEYMIVLDIGQLATVMNRIKKSETVTITQDGESRFVVKTEGTCTRRFYIPTMSPDMESPKDEPEINYTVEATINTALFKDWIDDALIVADSVKLFAKEKYIGISAEGDLGSVLNTVPDGIHATTKLKNGAKDMQSARYSLEYLKKMIMAGKPFLTTKLEFAHDHPLRMSWEDGDLKIAYLLAPRVETE